MVGDPEVTKKFSIIHTHQYGYGREVFQNFKGLFFNFGTHMGPYFLSSQMPIVVAWATLHNFMRQRNREKSYSSNIIMKTSLSLKKTMTAKMMIKWEVLMPSHITNEMNQFRYVLARERIGLSACITLVC